MTSNTPDPPRVGVGLAFADEQTIIALAQAGDQLAFAELLNRRQSSVRNLLRRLCGDRTLADDLAQETFLEAWRQLHRLRSCGAFGGWLRQIAVSKWLQYARSSDMFSSLPEEAGDGASVPHGVVLDLDAALTALSPDARLCVVLAYHEGMSHSEIASTTGMPLGTIKSHIGRGASQLRTRLQAYARSRS